MNDLRIPDQTYITLKLSDVIRFGYDILLSCFYGEKSRKWSDQHLFSSVGSDKHLHLFGHLFGPLFSHLFTHLYYLSRCLAVSQMFSGNFL